MTVKKVIEDEFNNKERVVQLRYKSSTLVLVVMTLLFFLSLFLYWATWSNWIYEVVIPIFYVLLIISLATYWYFALLKKFSDKINWSKVYILIVFLAVISIALLLPLFARGSWIL